MSDYNLSVEEVHALIQGKFVFNTCLECSGKGWVLVHEDGVVCQGIQVGTNSADYYKDRCDDCEGLGGFIKWT